MEKKGDKLLVRELLYDDIDRLHKTETGTVTVMRIYLQDFTGDVQLTGLREIIFRYFYSSSRVKNTFYLGQGCYIWVKCG